MGPAEGIDVFGVRMEKLSAVNYATWKFKTRMILIKEDLWDVVEGTTPEGMSEATLASKKRKALATDLSVNWRWSASACKRCK